MKRLVIQNVPYKKDIIEGIWSDYIKTHNLIRGRLTEYVYTNFCSLDLYVREDEDICDLIVDDPNFYPTDIAVVKDFKMYISDYNKINIF